MSDNRDVLDAQRAKFAALVAGDLEALAGMLDDRLAYVHANGEADDKAQFLRNVADTAIWASSSRAPRPGSSAASRS